MTDRTCSIDGCERVPRRKVGQLCEMHYTRLRRHGDPLVTKGPPLRAPLPPRNHPKGSCAVEGCERQAKEREWCHRHYQNWRTTGDPGTNTADRKPKGPCAVDGCGRRAVSFQWCDRHYRNWRLYGNPIRDRVRTGYVNNHGYRMLGWKEHPLAGKTGRISEHRAVLFNHIGPGEHPCNWCGKIVTWDVNDQRDPRALVVDHVTFDRLTNTPDVLVPSCTPCNAGRKQSTNGATVVSYAVCPSCLANEHSSCPGPEYCACRHCWPDTPPTSDADATPTPHQDDADDVDR